MIFIKIHSVVLGIQHQEVRFDYELFHYAQSYPPPLYKHYSNELSVCDAFDYTHVLYISDTFLIIISVFNAQFIHYTKYAKYAFLLLLLKYMFMIKH